MMIVQLTKKQIGSGVINMFEVNSKQTVCENKSFLKLVLYKIKYFTKRLIYDDYAVTKGQL
jgi:hypothetical protein